MLRRCCGDRPRAMILALVCCCFTKNVEPEDKTHNKPGEDDFYAPIKDKKTKGNKRGKRAKNRGRKGRQKDQETKIVEKGSGDSQEIELEGPSTSQMNTKDDDKHTEYDKTYQETEGPPEVLQEEETKEPPETNDSNPELLVSFSNSMQDNQNYYYCSRGISSEDEDKKECERQFDYSSLEVTCEDSDEDLFRRIQSLERISPDLPESETEGNVDYVFPTFQEIASRVEESIEKTFGRDPFTLTAEELTWVSENPGDIETEFEEIVNDDFDIEGKHSNDPWEIIQETKFIRDSTCSGDGSTQDEFDFCFLLEEDKEKRDEDFYSVDCNMTMTETSQTTEDYITVDEENRDLRGVGNCFTCGFSHTGLGHVDGVERGPTRFALIEKCDKTDEESTVTMCPETAFAEYNWCQNMKNKEVKLVKEDDSDDDGFPLLHSVGRKSRERNRMFRSSREEHNTRGSPASPVPIRLHMSMAMRGLQSGDAACSDGILKWHTRRSTLKAANKTRLSEKRCHRRNY